MFRRKTLFREVFSCLLASAAAVFVVNVLILATIFIEYRILEVEYDGGIVYHPVLALLLGVYITSPAVMWCYGCRFVARRFDLDWKFEALAGAVCYVGFWVVFYVVTAWSFRMSYLSVMGLAMLGGSFIAFWSVQRLVLQAFRWKDDCEASISSCSAW